MTITHSSSLISITFTICTVSIYVCFGFFCLFICGQSSTIFSCALLKMKIKTIKFITFSCFVHTTDTYSQQKQQPKWKENRVKILYWKIQVKIHNILYGICQFVLLVWSKNRKKIVPSLSFDRSFQKDHFKKKKKMKKENAKSQQHRNWSSALLQAMSISTRKTNSRHTVIFFLLLNRNIHTYVKYILCTMLWSNL